MQSDDEKLRSRTLTLSNLEWSEICQVADLLGFGERSRSRAILKMARDTKANLKDND